VQVIYRAAQGVSVLDLAVVFGVSAKEIALKTGGNFLEEGQYLFLEKGAKEYHRAEEKEIRALQKNKADYVSACEKYCVPFLYLGMPMEK